MKDSAKLVCQAVVMLPHEARIALSSSLTHRSAHRSMNDWSGLADASRRINVLSRLGCFGSVGFMFGSYSVVVSCSRVRNNTDSSRLR